MANKKINPKFIYITLLIILVIIVGVVVDRDGHLPIDETINLVDLLTLVATVFLAVYIPKVLDRKLEVSRNQKELVEHRIADLQQLFRRINLLVQETYDANERDMLMINNTLDVCQHRLSTIASLVKYSKKNVSLQQDITVVVDLAKEYKDLLWIDKTNTNVSLYTQDIRQKEEELYNQLDEKTCLLIFKLNEE